jgi:adenosylcobinamide-GDP ribazoletransferase
MDSRDPLRSQFDDVIDDLRSSIAFMTRLPAGWFGPARTERPDFRRAARVFPVVGGLVGLIGGVILIVAARLGEPLLVAAGLAVAVTMLVTGGLHEDGLADTVDGFGGGNTAARKLEIMDDSRIGAFGAAALVFSILFRVGALATLAAGGASHAALALVAAEAVSRAASVRLWHHLPAVRLSGLAHDTGTPDQNAMLIALAIAGAIVVITVVPTLGLAAAVVGCLCAAAATYGFTRLSAQAIGGRTGDTLGACQQIAAVAFLIGVAVFG